VHILQVRRQARHRAEHREPDDQRDRRTRSRRTGRRRLPLCRRVPTRSRRPPRIRDGYAPTPIVTTTLGDLAGAVGAALWAAEQRP